MIAQAPQADGPGAQAFARVASQTDFHAVIGLATEALTFDWRLPPLDNSDAWQALCLAVNRDALAPLFSGNQFVPSWHLVPQGTPGYNAGLTGIDGVTATSGDMAKAETHWRAYLATLHGQPVPPITYYYGAQSAESAAMAAALARQWNAALGAALGAGTVTTQPFTYVNNAPVPRAPQLANYTSGTDYADPQVFLA
jgi:peptide/nickel transport system substrate-binding protein/oligopeptide transport system substrate-binding protein